MLSEAGLRFQSYPYLYSCPSPGSHCLLGWSPVRRLLNPFFSWGSPFVARVDLSYCAMYLI